MLNAMKVQVKNANFFRQQRRKVTYFCSSEIKRYHNSKFIPKTLCTLCLSNKHASNL